MCYEVSKSNLTVTFSVKKHLFNRTSNWILPFIVSSISSFCGSLAACETAISLNRTLRDLVKRKSCHQLLCNSKREWSFSSQEMEVNVVSSHFNEKQSIDYSEPAKEENMPTGKNGSTSILINQAEIAWHENRRKWIGDQSQRPKRMDKDPIISWSTTYDELLSNNEPFSEPIPLPEMVDFLVDIWHDEGLFD